MPGAGPVCHAPRLEAPGPDRFTGVLGSWWPEGCGKHSYPPGKTRRGGVSQRCRFIARGGTQMGGARDAGGFVPGGAPGGGGVGGGGGGGGCSSQGWTQDFLDPWDASSGLTILSGFSCTWFWGAALWCLHSLALPPDFNQGLCR